MGQESWTHRGTKELLSRMVASGPGHVIVSIEEDFRWSSYKLDTSGCKIIVECAYPNAIAVPDADDYYAEHGRYPNMIFDVGLVKDGQVVAAFEVMHSNWIDEKKRKKILKSKVLVVGVPAKSDDWVIDNIRIDAREIIRPDGYDKNRLTMVRIGSFR